MALYAELFELRGDSTLRNQVAVAMLIAAETIRGEDGATPNHANRLLWAKDVFEGTQAAGNMLAAVLAANKDAAVPDIRSASDATIQTNVSEAVDLFATGS